MFLNYQTSKTPKIEGAEGLNEVRFYKSYLIFKNCDNVI